jgi:hypothetical protein
MRPIAEYGRLHRDTRERERIAERAPGRLTFVAAGDGESGGDAHPAFDTGTMLE